MKIERTARSNSEQSFRVTVPAADVEKALSARLKELAETAKFPGFRPGKVPVAVARQRFGAEAERGIIDGFAQNCIGETLRKHKIAALDVRLDGEPSPRNAEEDLKIEFFVDVAPKVKLIKFSRIKIEVPETDVTDADIEEGIETLSLLCGKTERADESHGALEKDVLDIDVIDRTGEEERELAIAASFDPPGFRRLWGKGAEIAGLKRNDERTLDVETSPDADLGPYAGRTLRLGIRVRDVHKRTPATRPEIAQRIGLKNERDLLPTVRKQVIQETEQASKTVLWHRALEGLVDAHSFRLPEKFLERKVDQILTQSGQNPEEVATELRDTVRKSGERRIRLTLLLETIAEENKLEVPFQEAAREITTLVPNDAKDPQAEFNKLLADADTFMATRRRILESKAFGLLLEQITRNSVGVSREELQTLTRSLPQPPIVPRSPESDKEDTAMAPADNQGEGNAKP